MTTTDCVPWTLTLSSTPHIKAEVENVQRLTPSHTVVGGKSEPQLRSLGIYFRRVSFIFGFKSLNLLIKLKEFS